MSTAGACRQGSRRCWSCAVQSRHCCSPGIWPGPLSLLQVLLTALCWWRSCGSQQQPITCGNRSWQQPPAQHTYRLQQQQQLMQGSQCTLLAHRPQTCPGCSWSLCWQQQQMAHSPQLMCGVAQTCSRLQQRWQMGQQLLRLSVQAMHQP